MRKQGWEKLLNSFMEQNHHTPFEWGKFDCVLMCGLWADLCTGREDAQQWVGKYDSEESAEDVIAQEFGGITAIFDRYYHAVRPQMAWTGDVVLVQKGDGKPTCAIKHSGSVLVAGQHGMLVIPLNTVEILKAWRIE